MSSMSDDSTPFDSFEGAQFSARWALTEIDELKAALHAFANDQPCTMFERFDPKSGKTRAGLKFKPIPHRARGHASNTIKNLRDALDQAMHGASFLVSGKRKRNTHFPFGMCPVDFENAMKLNVCKDIPTALYPILREFTPYPTSDAYEGGNDVLRMLGRISGPHKHRVTLTIAPNAIERRILNPGPEDRKLNFGRGGGVLFPEYRFSHKQNEVVFIELGPGGEAHVDMGLTWIVVFSHPKLVNIAAVDFLSEAAKSVSHIIQRLQAKALELSLRA